MTICCGPENIALVKLFSSANTNALAFVIRTTSSRHTAVLYTSGFYEPSGAAHFTLLKFEYVVDLISTANIVPASFSVGNEKSIEEPDAAV